MTDIHEIEIAASRIPVMSPGPTRGRALRSRYAVALARGPGSPRTLLEMLTKLSRCEQLELLQDLIEGVQ